MKVIKRDGRIQDFELDKIVLTLEKASDEAEEPFNQSDIENITRTIEKKVMNRELNEINVDDIQDIVLSQLKEDGFNHIAQHYEEYRKDLYKK